MFRDRREGFEEYAAARGPQLRRLAFVRCGDRHLAEDLVQTALARLYVAWPRVAGPTRPSTLPALAERHPQRDSNPCYRRERATS